MASPNIQYQIVKQLQTISNKQHWAKGKKINLIMYFIKYVSNYWTVKTTGSLKTIASVTSTLFRNGKATRIQSCIRCYISQDNNVI